MPKPTSKPALPHVLILAGPELYLRNQQLAEIQSELFANEDPGMGLIRLDPASLGSQAMAIILDEVRTPSMFSPKKLVIVDPADPLFKKPDEEDDDDRLSNREILEHYIESPADATLVLVFNTWLKTTRIHKALDKLGAIRRCDALKDAQIPAWIARRSHDGYNKTIDPPAAQHLANLIGPDLQRLDNELAKLSLYQPNSPAITLDAVDALVGFQHQQKIWDMIDALAASDGNTALQKINELWALDPKIEYTASGAVFSWVNQVLKARELIDRRLPDALITKELKLWPPERAQKVMTMARKWGLAGAARWSETMLKMDIANKSSLGDPRRNLEKFVVQLCSA